MLMLPWFVVKYDRWSCVECVCVCVAFRDEWDWIQKLSDVTREEGEGGGPRAESHAPLLFYELQTAIKALLKHINLPLHQVRDSHL